MDQRSVWEQLTAKTFTLPAPPAALADAISADGRVLDIGCGYGRIMRALSRPDGPLVVGVDLAHGMLRRARAEGIESPLALMSAGALGLIDTSFDLVTLVAVLTAVAYPAAVQRVLDEAWRVLRPGGTLYVADFLIDAAAERQQRYREGQRMTGVWGMFALDGAQGGMVRHFDPTDLRRLVQHFYITDWQEQTARTMNDHAIRSIVLAARKPDDSALHGA